MKKFSAISIFILVSLGSTASAYPPKGGGDAYDDWRCRRLAYRAVEQANVWGYQVDCSPSAPQPVPYTGYTDHNARTIYLWTRAMTDDRRVIATLWHEVGHVAFDRPGRQPTTLSEETWAWGFSWCRAPQPGLGYPIKPTNCSPYEVS